MNQRMPGPRVVRPRRGVDFSAFQDTPTAEAAQRAAIEQARLNAGVPESPTPPIQLEAVRTPRIALPRPAQSQSEFFGGQHVVQLEPVLAGRSQAALSQAMAENRLTPEYQLQQATARRMSEPPSDATADELRALGYDEQHAAALASDAHDAPGARVGPSAADAVRHLSALTPALPEPPVAHQRPAPVVRRGAMGIPAMPSSAPSLEEGYAVRDGTLIPRAQPMQVPEGYAVTQDGQALPRAEPIPMSFVPTEQGGPTQSDLSPQDYAAMRSQGPAMTQGPNMSSDPSLYRSMPQGQGAAAEDNATMPVPIYDGGEITIDAGMYPADENGFPLAPQPQQRAPRPNVPRRRHAPYVAGLPNAPGGTAEMPSALAPNGVDALMNGSGIRTPQRSPLDTQRDTLALNVRYAQQRAQDAQAAGEGIADVEIARQRRLEQNEMDRQRAEGIARQNVQRAADRAAAIRIDPSRAMQGASGITNVIAVVLGGIGSGITGGPNQALQMVQQNIERDLAAQRTDLDTARNAVADQQSILGNIRQEFQSREAADNAFRENALRQAAAQVEIQAQRTNGAEAGDRASNLREQLVNAADQARVAAERAEMTQLLAFDRSRAETGFFDARTRATLATASGTEAANARRALMASRPRYPFGTLEWWQSQTPQQQAQRLENVQNTLLTGTSLRDAQVMYGVPEHGVEGERAPVENGARMATGAGAEGAISSIELGRRLTNGNTLLAGGMGAAAANAQAGLAPGTLERMALPAELAARVNVVDTNLRELEDAVASGGDVPGFGIFDGLLPDFTTPEGARLRRSADSLADAHQRMMSGAGGAVQEVQFYRDLLRGDGTEEGLRIGLETMRREMEAVVGNTAGGTSNVADQDALAAQLGVAPRVEAPAPEPAPGTPVRQRVPLLRARSSGSGRNLE